MVQPYGENSQTPEIPKSGIVGAGMLKWGGEVFHYVLHNAHYNLKFPNCDLELKIGSHLNKVSFLSSYKSKFYNQVFNTQPMTCTFLLTQKTNL